MAISQNPAATAAAEPLEEPPGVCAKFLGFRVNPGSDIANSVVTVFPTITAPAFNSFVTLLACGPENRSVGRFDPHAVG